MGAFWFILIFWGGCFLFIFAPSLSNFRERQRDDKCKSKFALNELEKQQLDEQYPLIKEHFRLTFCIEETIRFYLSVFRELSSNKQSDSDYNKNLMQYCIYLIKDKYDFEPISEEKALTLQEILSSEDIALIQEKSESIASLSNEEEKKLFIHDKQRWKQKYNKIIQEFDINQPTVFYEKIVWLASLNREIRLQDAWNIFYKAYSFMVVYHKATSLKLYLQYLNIKNYSNTFVPKQISMRNAPKLFKDKEQKAKFDAICKQFDSGHDLEKALYEIDVLYMLVRRKIKLNVDSIQDAKTKQANVAKILGAYLDDESIPETAVNIGSVKEEEDTSQNNRKELFDLFITNEFRLNQQEVYIFAQSKGIFKDHFIESINEQYYETLDDLLIEEEGEEYILNEAYYHKIAAV